MKANNFRIGNLIWREGFAVCKIEPFMFDCLNTKEEIDLDLKPIKLTEEWLAKFGYVKGFYSGHGKLQYFNNGELLDIVNVPDMGFYQTEGTEYLIGQELKFVHELQNRIFSIDGIEPKLI